MKKFRIRLAVVAAITGMLAMFAPAPARAAHTCGLDGTGIVDSVCENYHNPKTLIQIVVFCVVYAQNFCLPVE